MAGFVKSSHRNRVRPRSAPASFRARFGAGAIAIAVAWAPSAVAQNANDPFFESTVQLSQAIGFERVFQELLVIQSLDRPYPSELNEVIHGIVGDHFKRFVGTLSDIDADLAAELFRVLDAIDEGIERNQLVALDVIDVVSWVQIAFALLDDAYNLVVPREIRDEPTFRAAIMAQLLLGEGGVADSLKVAFSEEWQFADGWAATQRVKVMWAGIRDLATTEQQIEVDEAIAALDDIYTSIQPSLEGLEPEEAEAPAQRVVGLLETVVDAQLYVGRDPLGLAGYLTQLAAEGCTHYEAGDDRRGREVMYAVLDHYAGDTTGFGATIGTLAPEAHVAAIGALEALVAVDDIRDVGRLVNIRRAINAAENAPVGAAPVPAAAVDEVEMTGGGEVCRSLVEALGEANAVLGG
jgi:hypothetical protein